MARLASTFPEARPAFAVRNLTGAVELDLAEGLSRADTRPGRVSAVLTVLFDSVAAAPLTADRAAALASGTREWLMQRAACIFWPRPDWMTASCQACAARYDLQLDLAELPLKPAGESFPEVHVETSLGRRRFEAPNGVHELALARLALTGEAARRQLTALCGLDDDCRAAAGRYSMDDLERIDAVLERLSPEAVDTIESTCPTCGAHTFARVDPLEFAFPARDSILREVHLLAGAYHWSEREILSLPSDRRRHYLGLIRAAYDAGRNKVWGRR